MTYKVKVIFASTRPGRRGLPLGHWITKLLEQDSRWDVDFLDLKEVDLPFLDEAAHPRLRQYEKDHTLKWSKIIDEADAYVFVTAEYNHVPPPTLQNAINFLHQEWAEKPVAFVSYGGVSGGTRAMEALIPALTTLGMMPMPIAVNVPFFTKYIDDNDQFQAEEVQKKAAEMMINQLSRWAGGLKQMREAAN